MFACPGLIFYTVCSVAWLNGNLALAEKCSGPLRFRLRQVLLYNNHKLVSTRFKVFTAVLEWKFGCVSTCRTNVVQDYGFF